MTTTAPPPRSRRSLPDRIWGSLVGPARRLTVGLLAISVLFALGLGLAIWRYDAALDSYREVSRQEDKISALVEVQETLLERFSLAVGALTVKTAAPEELSALSAAYRSQLQRSIAGETSGPDPGRVRELIALGRRLERIERRQLYPATGAAVS